jgi:rhodanese-related sulfurtransferase
VPREGRRLQLALCLALAGCSASGPASGPEAARGRGCELDLDCAEGRVCEEQRCIRWWKLHGDPPEVPARELRAMLDTGEPPQLLDVRTRAEFEAGHIEGAISVPLGQLQDQLDALPLDRNRPVVAICLTAHRSIPAVRMLSRRGYRVAHLRGGMLAWRRARLPTTKD